MTRSRLLTVWAALTLLAALSLWGVTFLDLAMAGRTWTDAGPCPYMPADSVRYGLSGFRFFCGHEAIGGLHPSYPLVLITLALNALLLWLMRGKGPQARRMLRVNLWTLLLTLGLGWPVLAVGERVENKFLAGGDVLRAEAGPALLQAERCEVRETAGRCTRQSRLWWPNPTAWGLIGLALTGAAGWRRGKDEL